MKRPTPLKNIIGFDSKNLRRLAGNIRQLEQLNKRLARVLPATTCQHCQITSIRDQSLTLCCESAAWATRIRFEQSKIIKAFYNLGITSVSIHILQANAKPLQPTDKKARTISPKAAKLLTQLADSASDEAFKAALQRLAQRIK